MKNDSNEFQINIEEYFFKPSGEKKKKKHSMRWTHMSWPLSHSMMIILYHNANHTNGFPFIVCRRNSNLSPLFNY